MNFSGTCTNFCRFAVAFAVFVWSAANLSGQGAPVVGAVVSSATFATQRTSPGEYVSIFGSNFSTVAAAGTFSSSGLSTDIGGTSVRVEGILAPLLYVSPGQINAIIPFGVSRTPAALVVSRQGQVSTPFSVPLADSNPGLYTVNQSGTGQAAALNQDVRINSQANPAAPGSVIVLYGIGMGRTTPACPDGQIAPSSPLARPLVPVSVTIDGIAATVLFAGAAPGFICGFMQINVLVPSGVNRSPAPVVVTIGPNSSPAGVTVFVGTTAAPAPQTRVTISSTPPGRSVLVDGAAVTTPRDFQWNVGSSHTLEVVTPQSAGSTRYRFDRWSTGPGTRLTVTAPSEAATYNAAFTTEHQLITTVSPANGGSVAAAPVAADGFYDEGARVQVQAVPNAGFTFSSFNGSLSGNTNPQALVMSAPRTINTVFAASQTSSARLIPDVTSLSFDALVGGQKPRRQVLTITATDGSERVFNMRVNYPSATAPRWVDLPAPSGRTPAGISVGAQINVIRDPGQYAADLVISSPGLPDVSLPLSLKFNAAPARRLELDVRDIQLTSTGDIQRQAVVLRNPSPLTLPFTYKVAVDSGPSGWLSVRSVAASASDEDPALLEVIADPTGLTRNTTYTGRVTIQTDAGETVEIPVVFALAGGAAPKALLTTELALNYRVNRDQSEVSDQLELVASGGNVDWTAQSNVAWLRVAQSSGQVQPGQIRTIGLTISAAQLREGSNKALITIQSNADGGTLLVPVDVLVLPRGYQTLIVKPTGLAFVAPSLDERTVTFIASRPGPVTVGSLQAWLTATATAGVGIPSTQATVYAIKVRVAADKLQIGENRGTITIQDSAGAPVTVSVLVYVPADQARSAVAGKASGANASACTPTRFFPLFSSLLPRFELEGGGAASTEVVMIDDCGNAVNSGVTGGVLNNRDPQLNFRPLGDGRWKTSWSTGSAGLVALNVLASDPSNGINTMQPESPVFATVVSSPTGPSLAKDQPFETEAGIRLPALSPGMRVRIRGLNLVASDGARPTVTIGGRTAQIITASATQVTILVPADLPVNVRMQLVLRLGEALSVPEPVIVTPTWPVLSAVPQGRRIVLTGVRSAEEIHIEGAGIDRASPIGPGLWEVILDRDVVDVARKIRR